MTDAQDAREATLIYPGVCSLCLFFFSRFQREEKRTKHSTQLTLKVRNSTFFSPNEFGDLGCLYTDWGGLVIRTSAERAVPTRPCVNAYVQGGHLKKNKTVCGQFKVRNKLRWSQTGCFFLIQSRHQGGKCTVGGIISLNEVPLAAGLISCFFYPCEQASTARPGLYPASRLCFLQWSAFFGTMRFTYQIGGVQAERWREYADAWAIDINANVFPFSIAPAWKGTEKSDKRDSCSIKSGIFFPFPPIWNSGCAAGSSDRDRIEEWTELNRSEAHFPTPPPSSKKEYDPVKSYGHASLFNEHYLSQRIVYAQELAGASPKFKR